jgi:hypothetical protein
MVAPAWSTRGDQNGRSHQIIHKTAFPVDRTGVGLYLYGSGRLNETLQVPCRYVLGCDTTMRACAP